MKLAIIREPIPFAQLKEFAESTHGDMAKVVVDIERSILTLGGEWHAEGEDMLLEDGSAQRDLWGANVYPKGQDQVHIEYTSLINIRPRQGNRSMVVESSEVRGKVKDVIDRLLLSRG